jgi:hypothetical protein
MLKTQLFVLILIIIIFKLIIPGNPKLMSVHPHTLVSYDSFS